MVLSAPRLAKKRTLKGLRRRLLARHRRRVGLTNYIKERDHTRPPIVEPAPIVEAQKPLWKRVWNKVNGQ